MYLLLHSTVLDIVLALVRLKNPTRGWCAKEGRFLTRTAAADAELVLDTLSGSKLRALLRENAAVPPWFSFPAVLDLLRALPEYRAPSQRGFCVLFTGLSGSGKSTLAAALHARLAASETIVASGRAVIVLDGDECRQWLSTGLGFSRADRETNVRRIARVAALIVQAGGIAIAAPIAPHTSARVAARAMIEAVSPAGFIECFVDAPLEECERRDVKGLYKMARAGKLAHFTGIDDPYEAPEAADVRVQTASQTIHESLHAIQDEIERRAFVKFSE
jgi:sulfate adenylyltransferase